MCRPAFDRVLLPALCLIKLSMLPLPAVAMSLGDVLDLALQNDSAFTASAQDLRGQQLGASLQETFLQPNISISQSSSYAEYSNTTAEPGFFFDERGGRAGDRETFELDSTNVNRDVRLSVRQTVFDRSLSHTVKQHRKLGESLRTAERALQIDFIAEIVDRYFTAIRSLLYLQDNYQRVLDYEPSLVGSDNDKKRSVQLDYVSTSELRLMAVEMQRSKNDLEQALAELELKVGRPLPELHMFHKEASVPASAMYSLSYWLAEIDNSPKIAELEARLASARYAVKAAKAAWLPKVGLSVDYGSNVSTTEEGNFGKFRNDNIGWTAMINFSAQLYDGGYSRRTQQQSVRFYEAAKALLADERKRIAAEINNTYRQWKINGQAFVSLLRLQQRLGLFLDSDQPVINSSYTNVNLRKREAQLDSFRNWVALEAVTGHLDAEDVGLVDDFLVAPIKIADLFEEADRVLNRIDSLVNAVLAQDEVASQSDQPSEMAVENVPVVIDSIRASSHADKMTFVFRANGPLTPVVDRRYGKGGTVTFSFKGVKLAVDHVKELADQDRWLVFSEFDQQADQLIWRLRLRELGTAKYHELPSTATRKHHHFIVNIRKQLSE